MTMIDFLPTGFEAAVLGALGGVVTYFLNQFVAERYRVAVRTRRLCDALLVDCVEILHRVNHLPFEFHRSSDDSDDAELRRVMKHPNGFVICGPLSETRELVTLLDQHGSRLVVRFFERWATFAVLENRYTAIYQKLLETAAQCGIADGRQASFRVLREEYWDQLRTSLAAMHETGKELCFFACQIFKQLGTFNEAKLPQYSGRRWQSWAEFETELRRYSPLVENREGPSVATTIVGNELTIARTDATPLTAVPDPSCVVRRRTVRARNDVRS